MSVGSGHQALQDVLADRISRHGPIHFSDYMDAALYDPEHGYYMRLDRDSSDYVTSVTAHPAFAEMIARHLDDLWDAIGRPDPFNVIELGSGDGTLAERILRLAAEHPWSACLNYVGVERSAARRRAAARAKRANFVGSLGDIGGLETAAMISNEFFDALPFDIARREGYAWVEERAALDGNTLVFVDTQADDRILSYAQRYAGGVPNGGRIEIRRGVADVFEQLPRIAERVVVTTIDYGGAAEAVHSARLAAGTALAFRDHGGFEDLLAFPGKRDLTAHVNFTELVDAGESVGLAAAPLVEQADFLTALGIGEYLGQIQGVAGMTPERYQLERRGIMKLVSPSELGRFRVLVQGRAVQIGKLRGIPERL